MSDKKNKEYIENTGFWEEAKENINEGARIVGEEAKELSEKVTSYSETVFGKLKDYTEDILSSGISLTKEAVNKAQEYASFSRQKNHYQSR